LKKHQAPSPAGEDWGDDCMDAGAIAEESKIKPLHSHHLSIIQAIFANGLQRILSLFKAYFSI
jgi:hypothetical protein